MLEILYRKMRNSDFPLYSLTFFTGYTVYSLKLVSITKLINSVSLSLYPSLMLGVGVSIFLFLKFAEKISTNNKKRFYLGSFSFASLTLILSVVGQSYFSEISLAITILFLSNIALSSIDTASKSFVADHSSILKNPSISNRLVLSEELGIITGSVLTLSLQSIFSSQIITYIHVIPSITAAAVILIISKLHKNKSEHSISKNKIDIQLSKYSFIKLAVGLFAIMLCVKQMQLFAVFMGIEQLKNSTTFSVSEIFSKISLLQTGLILSYLGLNAFKKSATTNWSSGFNVFFVIQGVLLFSLTIFLSPFAYIATGIGRKFLQHTVLNNALTILNSSMPYDARFKIKSMMEGYGNLFSYGFLAIMSSLVIFKVIPTQVIWGLTLALCFIGLILRKKLFMALSEYQIKQVEEFEHNEAINTCYGLANPESKIYADRLIARLREVSALNMKKAIVRVMGQVQAPVVAQTLMQTYKECDQEDIQLETIESLLAYKSHHIDLFLLSSLENMIKTQVSLGSIRKSLFNAIIYRTHHIAIPMVLKILQDFYYEQRIVANAVLVIGEIANYQKDYSLLDLLTFYLEPKYTRRVRSNALLYLYGKRRYSNQVNAAFNVFQNSQDEFDRNALAFLAGELKIKKLYHKILKASMENHHKNSTLLVALLKLNNDQAPEKILELILNSNEDEAITAINQVSGLEQEERRYLIYYHLIEYKPDHIENFIELLIKSKRDFENDIAMINTEAKRLGIHPNQKYNSIKIAA